MSRNHRRGRIALSRKIERDMEIEAKKEREENRQKALAVKNHQEENEDPFTLYECIERSEEAAYGK